MHHLSLSVGYIAVTSLSIQQQLIRIDACISSRIDLNRKRLTE